MKRVWGHVLAGLSLLTGVGVAISACAHDDSTVFVQDVLAPQLVTAGQVCVFTAQPTQPFISSGVLDVAFKYDYQPTYLLANQSVSEANASQLQTETATVTIQGAVVRITDSAGKQLKTFTRLAAATLYPATGSVPSYAPITVTTIDSDTVTSDPDIVSGVLDGQGKTVRLVTYVKFFGQNLGGTSVESDEFEFPVDICRDCLIGFSASDVNGQWKTPNCVGNGTSTSTQLPTPCFPGQDFAIDCQQCKGFVPDCNPNANNYIGPPLDGGTDAAGGG